MITPSECRNKFKRVFPRGIYQLDDEIIKRLIDAIDKELQENDCTKIRMRPNYMVYPAGSQVAFSLCGKESDSIPHPVVTFLRDGDISFSLWTDLDALLIITKAFDQWLDGELERRNQ